MKISEEGTYTITYTATDKCGNSTTENRTVVVKSMTRTVLYSDGTLVINEQVPRNETVVKEYPSFGEHDYVFTRGTALWYGEKNRIKAVEIGSPIKPTSMSAWFYGCLYIASYDFTNIDTSNVTDMSWLFSQNVNIDQSPLTSLDLSNFDTSNVTTMAGMFGGLRNLTAIVGLDQLDTSKVISMNGMFSSTAVPSLDLTNFDTSNVRDMQYMFSYTGSSVIDLSSFDTSNVTNMTAMFYRTATLTTIYASSKFVTTNATVNFYQPFDGCTGLRGGGGTIYNQTRQSLTYARIDNPPNELGYFTAKE